MLTFKTQCDTDYCSYPMISCTSGDLCPINAETNQDACKPGYYSNSGVCSICSPGFYCPDGSTIEACPQGRYCDEFGLTTPTGLCPPGMICDLYTVYNVNYEFIVLYAQDTELYENLNSSLILRGRYANISNYNDSHRAICFF